MNADSFSDINLSRRQLPHAPGSSEALVAAILGATFNAIISIDERGIIQMINPATERLFGYSADELIGRNVKLLMPSPHNEEHDGYLARYLATGERRIIGIGREVIARRKDGSTFPVEVSVAEARTGGERLFVGILRDITERKQMEEQFRFVVESTPSAIVLTREDGSIVLVNSQTERFFGYCREELIGQSVEILVPERFRVIHATYRTGYSASPSPRPMGAGRDLYGRRKDGSEFPVEIGLAPLHTKHVRKSLFTLIGRVAAGSRDSLRKDFCGSA